MNCSVYIFGELSSGYTQYPEDSSSHILSNLITNCKAETQLVVKREDNLMYYSYIRKLENKKYIGLSILVNGYYIQNIQDLFSIFEKTLEELVTTGSIVCFSHDGKIVPSQKQLKEQEEDIDSISINLSSEFNNAGKSYKLPSVDYSVAKDSIKEYRINDDKRHIVRSSYTYGFTYIYKDKDFNTVKIDSYQGVLSRVSRERDEFKSRNVNLSLQLSKVKAQKRNLIWVSVLGGVVLVLGLVVWNKVLFPSEVTRYQTENFLYYGPMQNKKPHGEGVAFYPTDDKDGRRYYIGHFVNGERQDSTAMLYYQNGDYFFGTMNGDKFMKGIFYSNSDNSHFEGSFVDNKPYEGTWYNHEESYKLKDGEMK